MVLTLKAFQKRPVFLVVSGSTLYSGLLSVRFVILILIHNIANYSHMPIAVFFPVNPGYPGPTGKVHFENPC